MSRSSNSHVKLPSSGDGTAKQQTNASNLNIHNSVRWVYTIIWELLLIGQVSDIFE